MHAPDTNRGDYETEPVVDSLPPYILEEASDRCQFDGGGLQPRSTSRADCACHDRYTTYSTPHAFRNRYPSPYAFCNRYCPPYTLRNCYRDPRTARNLCQPRFLLRGAGQCPGWSDDA